MRTHLTRIGLLGLLLFLLTWSSGVAAAGEDRMKLLDLRTKAEPGSRVVVFVARPGTVGHALVATSREVPRGAEPVVRVFGLHPGGRAFGVPTAEIGAVEKTVVEDLLSGDLAADGRALVCQVDEDVLARVEKLYAFWVGRAESGLTSRDAATFLREAASAVGLRTPAGAEALTAVTLVPALMGANDGTSTPTLATGAPVAAVPSGITLPRVGTLGQAPSGEGAIIVVADASGRITVGDSRPLGLLEVRRVLHARTADPAWRESDGSSKKALVIQADEALPWRFVQWIMQTAADPRVRIYKIFFAAQPRSGDAVGALGSKLPKDRGICPTTVIFEEKPRLSLRCFMNSAQESDPEALFPLIARWRAEMPDPAVLRLEIKVPPPKGRTVPTGFIVRILDVALRAGVTDVMFEGAPPPMRTGASGGTAEDLMAEARGAEAGLTPTIRLANGYVGALPPGTPIPPARGLLPGPYGIGVGASDPDATQRAIPDEEIEDHVETDCDLPFEESLGEEGISDAPFSGPSNNGTIGIGGGAGGAFRGRGGSRDLGTPSEPAVARKPADGVQDALRWLAAHQSPNGGWEAAGFGKWCDGNQASQGPDGLGKALYDPGVTGLALCAFLGAGYTNRGRHPFAKVVAKGLRYLKNAQDVEGCFGPRTSQHYIYNHGTAALAMVEAYGMTGSPIFKGSAQRALDFIALARNPYFAWRYGVKPGDNDTSVTGWMAMALKSASLINADAKSRGNPGLLVLDEEALLGVRNWVDKMTDPDFGRTGYLHRGGSAARPQELIDRFPGDKSESMTAVGILLRVFGGEDPSQSPLIQKGASLCTGLLPTWNAADGSIDMYYWYYGTLAMFQVGGSSWARWKRAIESALLDNQRRDGTYCQSRGSWDPIGPWGPDGGRVYSTAMLAMCLEAGYRYERLFPSSTR